MPVRVARQLLVVHACLVQPDAVAVAAAVAAAAEDAADAPG